MADHDDFFGWLYRIPNLWRQYKKAQVEARHLSVIPEVPGVPFGWLSLLSWHLHCLRSAPVEKALQSIHPGHTAPLHIQPWAGAITPAAHTQIVRQAARTIRAVREDHTQATGIGRAANPRAAHQISTMQSPMLILMTFTMITMMTSGITRMQKSIGARIKKNRFLFSQYLSMKYGFEKTIIDCQNALWYNNYVYMSWWLRN